MAAVGTTLNKYSAALLNSAADQLTRLGAKNICPLSAWKSLFRGE
jgi:hypothetical protein